MAPYFEPTSMTGCSARMCADRAVATRLGGPARIDPPRHGDALSSKVCRRCGCATDAAHVDANACIEALREALAEVWAGEVRRIGRPQSARNNGG